MTYQLQFDHLALKEWDNLVPPIKAQFKKKLAERLENPHVPSARLRSTRDRYKIKLKASGVRLLYQVNGNIMTVLVITVRRHECNKACLTAEQR